LLLVSRPPGWLLFPSSGRRRSVARYAVGDEVFGFLLHANPTVHDGSWAELIAVPQDMFIGRAPQGVDLATAGAAPLAGIAAIIAIDALELSDDDTVLIVGATSKAGSTWSDVTWRNWRRRVFARVAREVGLEAPALRPTSLICVAPPGGGSDGRRGRTSGTALPDNDALNLCTPLRGT
jgi:hypothetical protein